MGCGIGDVNANSGSGQIGSKARGDLMTFALVIAGIGAVIVLGTWIGVCVADGRDSERDALEVGDAFLDELDMETRNWR